MFEHLRCVALRTVKYDDRHNIVTAWSVERGRVGLLVPTGASREAARRRALMMPMALFEGEADVRPDRDLFNIRDVKPLAVLPAISSSPSKTVVAMFLAEVLEKILRDSPPDLHLSEFIFKSVVTLDSLGQRGTANFPLVFLCRLGGFLGIEPDSSTWSHGMVLDMSGGVYRSSVPLNGRWLEADETAVASMIQRLTYDTAGRLALPRQLRRSVLDRILEYYTIHHAPLDSLRSLPVLRDLL